MIEWINEYIKRVETRPSDFNIDIKNNIRQIKELISRKDIVYKEGDPLAFEEFCKKAFKHREGIWAGKAIELNLEQKYMIACLLGIKEFSKEYNKWIRYFNEFDLFVARKWGKDTFIAPLMCYFLAIDREPKAWGQIVAENKSQSQRTFDIVEGEIKYKPLDKYFKKIGSGDRKEIICKIGDGKLQYLSGRNKGKDGGNPSFAVANEVHEITNYNQYNSLKSGMGARMQPMMIVISSAGITPASLYENLQNRNRKFLEKKKLGKGDHIFAVMYGIDDIDDFKNEDCWIKANPAMYEGRPTMTFLRNQYAAMKDDPETLATFISKHLNRQIGAALNYFDLMDIKKSMVEIKRDDIFNTYAVGGVDLSSTTDLCNATAMILKPDGKKVIIQAYFIASECIERNSRKDKMEYNNFVDMKTENEITSHLVYVTTGSCVDYKAVTNWFCELRDKYKISFLKIGYDKAMSNYWANDMIDHGFAREKVVFDKDNQVEERDYGILTPCYQGYGLDEAIRTSRNMFADEKYVIDKNNMLLVYCFYNVRVINNQDNRLAVSKAKSNGHIDGTIGVFNSYEALTRAKECDDYKLKLSKLF